MKHFYAMVIACALTSAMAFPSLANEKKRWLFVMTGNEMQATGSTLVVKDEDKMVFGFTDRPYRDHANVGIEKFVSFWDKGRTFKIDPPNAVLTYEADGKKYEVEVLLTSARVTADGVAFDIKVEAGTLPTGSGPYSLFIDALGMIV